MMQTASVAAAAAETPLADWSRPSALQHFSVSIIVPVLNEASLIGSFLEQLRARAPGAEIIVADGGSSDGTTQIAAGLCDRIVSTKSNRAVQLNAGARLARGDILWFLHVDVEVPAFCLDEIARTLDDRRIAGGYFRIRLPGSHLVYRLTDNFAHYAGMLLRMRCGDHGFFCRRQAFEMIGGFPEVPLMEDVEFFRKLHRHGKVACIHRRMAASARRYEQVGSLRLTLGYGLIAILYAVGTPLPILARIYQYSCCEPGAKH